MGVFGASTWIRKTAVALALQSWSSTFCAPTSVAVTTPSDWDTSATAGVACQASAASSTSIVNSQRRLRGPRSKIQPSNSSPRCVSAPQTYQAGTTLLRGRGEKPRHAPSGRDLSAIEDVC
jgi:hypothetical protein